MIEMVTPQLPILQFKNTQCYAELKRSVLMVIVAGDRMINNRSAHRIWLESFISVAKFTQ